jgi:hypothetical protein
MRTRGVELPWLLQAICIIWTAYLWVTNEALCSFKLILITQFKKLPGLLKLKPNRQCDEKAVAFLFRTSAWPPASRNTPAHVYGTGDRSWLVEKKIKRCTGQMSIGCDVWPAPGFWAVTAVPDRELHAGCSNGRAHSAFVSLNATCELNVTHTSYTFYTMNYVRNPVKSKLKDIWSDGCFEMIRVKIKIANFLCTAVNRRWGGQLF